MVKNPPCNAGDTGSIPGLGRSHVPAGQLRDCGPVLLSPCTLEPVHQHKRSHCDEKPGITTREEPPLTATRESPSTATDTVQRKMFKINQQN